MLKLDFCDVSDVYVVVKRTKTVADINANNRIN